MALQKTLLATVITLSLAACGGGDASSGNAGGGSTDGGSTLPAKASLSGKAADGYLEGALVCLDINQNKTCDGDEPSATTDKNGAFMLDATQAQIDSAALLVEVIAGTTIDSDFPGVAIEKGYSLSAPAASAFVSPITTLIQNEIEKGATVEESVAAVKALLGTDTDITADYIEGKNGETNAEDYAKLHNVSQVIARVISAKLDELSDHAENQGVSKADLVNVIVEEVSKVVGDVVSDVESAGEAFNPDTVADTVKTNVEISTDNVKDKINANNADRDAKSASIAALIEESGLLWLGSERDGDTAVLQYGTLTVNKDGSVSDVEFVSTADYSGFEPVEATETLQYILTEAGWVKADDTIVGVEKNDKGEEFLVTATQALSMKVRTSKVDVSELSVADIVAKTADNEAGAWESMLTPALTFPANTFAYKLKMSDVTPSYFSFNAGDWCGEEQAQAQGGMCNSVYLEGEALRAQSLEQLIDESPDGDVTGMFSMVGIPGGAIMAELYENGAVKFYEYAFSDGALNHMANGAWSDVELHGKTLRKLIAPNAVAKHPDMSWNNFNTDDNAAYFAVVNDFVRVVWQETSASYDEYVFGADLLPLFEENVVSPHPITLAQCLASLPDANYEQKVGDTITYDAFKAVDWVNEGALTQYVETFEYQGNTFSWLSKFNTVSDMPSWVAATDGALKKTLFSAYNLNNELLHMEAAYSDSNTYYGEEGLDAEGNYGWWGGARATLPDTLDNADKRLNTPHAFSFEKVRLNDLLLLSEFDVDYDGVFDGGSFNDLVRTRIDATETYEGQFDVTVPAGTFSACKVTERVRIDGGSVEDVDTRWYTNRGVVKQEVRAPSWTSQYDRLAVSLPE